MHTPHLTEKDFIKLLNLIHELSGTVRLPNEYDNPFLFVRALAFQQFWWQENFVLHRFGRQGVLFGHLDNGHTFSTDFISLTGISIPDFIELSMIVLSHLSEKTSSLDMSFINALKHIYPDETVDGFFSALSQDVQGIQEYLRSRGDKSNLTNEYYEQSPLKRFPLLRFGERYFCYSYHLLYHSLQSFLFDALRANDPQRFMREFGLIFEDYVKRCLVPTKLPCLSEKQLEQALGVQGKVVDIVAVDDDTNIFIDAKGVELTHLGMVTHLSDIIRNRTKDSILRGIEQGFETACRLANITSIDGVNLGGNVPFLIIVTFKDLYIEQGQDFYDLYAKEKIDELAQKFEGKHWIPLDHMYFMSIDDFELFLQCSTETQKSLTYILKQAVLADRNPMSAKFLFRMHVSQECPNLPVLEHLDNEYLSWIERIEIRFGGSTNGESQ